MATVNKTPADADRLPVRILDDIAQDDPSRPFLHSPRSSDPKDGWEPITFREAANAINFIAHKLVETHGRPAEGSFPRILYIGPSDARYILFMFGAIKAGYVAFVFAPRNTDEIKLHLVEKAECRLIWHPASHAKMCQPLVEKANLTANIFPDLATLTKTPVDHFPYDKTPEEAAWDPIMMFQTSGSTGFPKPVIRRNGAVLNQMDCFNWGELHGLRLGAKTWPDNGVRKIFLTFPLVYGAGPFFCMYATLCLGLSCILPIADKPFSADVIRESLKWSEADAAILLPSIIEDLATTEEGVQALLKLKWALFGGGSLPPDTGDRLVERGVHLLQAFGHTEAGMLPFYRNPDPKLWRYHVIPQKLLNCELRPVPGLEEDVKEAVIVRPASPSKRMQSVFYTFPDLKEWDTGDLFRAHPTLPDHWIHCGRKGDVIKFTNAEYLNPVDIESTVSAHPLVREALVVGAGRPQAALILEPLVPIVDKDAAEDFIREVWPVIDAANKKTVGQGRIVPSLVMVAPADKPFLRAGKGTLQRRPTVQYYEEEIEALYKAAEHSHRDVVPLDKSTLDGLTQSVVDIFSGVVGDGAAFRPDTDFVADARLDSIHVVAAARKLWVSCQEAGLDRTVTPNTVFAHPTPRKLAEYLLS